MFCELPIMSQRVRWDDQSRLLKTTLRETKVRQGSGGLRIKILSSPVDILCHHKR